MPRGRRSNDIEMAQPSSTEALVSKKQPESETSRSTPLYSTPPIASDTRCPTSTRGNWRRSTPDCEELAFMLSTVLRFALSPSDESPQGGEGARNRCVLRL